MYLFVLLYFINKLIKYHALSIILSMKYEHTTVICSLSTGERLRLGSGTDLVVRSRLTHQKIIHVQRKIEK